MNRLILPRAEILDVDLGISTAQKSVSQVRELRRFSVDRVTTLAG